MDLPQLLEPATTGEKRKSSAIHQPPIHCLSGLLSWIRLLYSMSLTDLSRLKEGGYVAKIFTATLLFHGFLLIGPALGWKDQTSSRNLFLNIGRTAGPLYPRMKNLILAILLAVILCLPWYFHHGSFIRYSTILTATQDAAYRGFPSISNPGSLLQYFFFFENHQVHLLYFLLFLFALGVGWVKARDTLFPLLFGLLIAYSGDDLHPLERSPVHHALSLSSGINHRRGIALPFKIDPEENPGRELQSAAA